MKTPALAALLAVALAANAWLLRSQPASRPAAVDSSASQASAGAVSVSLSARPAALTWSALPYGDHAKLAAALRSAGIPTHLQSAFLAAAIEEHFRLREEALRGPRKPLKYWQTEPVPTNATRTALLELRREKSRLRVSLLGPDPADATDESNPLPLEKRSAARLIEEDYRAALRELRTLAGARDGLLPTERAQLTALETARRAEPTALLSPAELAEFDARSSPAAQEIRSRIFAMDPTEDEFRRILAARIAVEEEMRGTDRPVVSPVDFLNREDLRTKLNEAVKVAVGEARFADYQRATAFEFQALARVASRAGAPLANAAQAWDLRLSATQESTRIAENQSLTEEQKGAALQTLTHTTRDRYAALIGPEAAETYLKSQSASWFTYLEQGWAVTLRDNGMGMRPVSPAAKAASQQRPRPAAPTTKQ